MTPLTQPLTRRRRAGPLTTEHLKACAKRARQRRWRAAHAEELRAADRARYDPVARAARYAANIERERAARKQRYAASKSRSSVVEQQSDVPRRALTAEERLAILCAPTVYAEPVLR